MTSKTFPKVIITYNIRQISLKSLHMKAWCSETGGCGVFASYKLCSMRFCIGHILLSLLSDKLRQSFVLLAVLENLKVVLAVNSH